MPARPEIRARYPSDWRAISRRIREDRAEGRCECAGECGDLHGGRHGRCGAPNGELIVRLSERPWVWRRLEDLRGSDDRNWGRTVRVVLTVAHLDGDPANCDDLNLRALCQRCHLRLDGDQHAESVRRGRRLALEAAGQLALLAPEGQA